MRVSQVLCAAGPVDAVTNQALACRRLFHSWGWDGADYAPVIAPGVQKGAIHPLHQFEQRGGELVLLHYSGFARGLEELLDGSRRNLLLSHNITPARYFWPYEPADGVRCELARGQLATLACTADQLAGVSEYNARELRELSARDAGVIPILFERDQLAPPGRIDDGPPTVLFVGRLTPHKRQDLVIRAFASYHRLRPDARLVLVGVPLSAEFGARLERLAAELAPGAVTFESGVSTDRLADLYRRAHVFLCLSEHEGFCIPLLEAFHFGVPVIARDAGAISEVVGDAGVLVGEQDDVETVAELLRIVVDDHELREELRLRAQRRLDVYDHARTADRLRGTLTELAGS